MPRNIETKARVHDPACLRERVAALSTAGPECVHQRDTFFECPTSRLKLRDYGDGSAELIVYERGDETGPALSSYRKCSCADAQGLRAVLGEAYGVRAEVVKSREVFWIGRTRVHLDDVKGLGHFMELEVTLEDDAGVSEGQQEASALMHKLGIDTGDRIAVAYVDLLLADG